MTVVTVKSIPDNLYTRLKSIAEMNRRSVNREIIVCIQKAAGNQCISPEKTLEDARRPVGSGNSPPITLGKQLFGAFSSVAAS